MSLESINIWRFVDGKKGHEKQSLGLLQGLQTLDSRIRFEDVAPHLRFSRNTLKSLSEKLPPHLLVGAGHGVHLPMLRCKLAFGGKTVLLMKPSLPCSLFNLVFVPDHDAIGGLGNVIRTRGPLSPVALKPKVAQKGLILLGGPSKHFSWEQEKVLQAVESIATANKTTHWNICDSRRTPPDVLAAVPDYSNVSKHAHQEVSENFLQDEMSETSLAWVTADSVSMVYECLSHRISTGVIDTTAVATAQRSKIGKSLSKLVEDNVIQRFHDSLPVLNCELNIDAESQNLQCAKVVYNRLLENGLVST